MITVVGTGYTGARLLKRISEARGISRSVPEGLDADRLQLADLDGNDEVSLETLESVVYTVPPAAGTVDPRLVRFFSALSGPPRRFVYLSTTGVYGDHEGGTVTERTPAVPETDRARRRLAAEQLLLSWASEHGVEAVILRVPGIYGPGRLGTARVRERQPQLRDLDAGPGNRIHVDDLVEACVLAAQPGAPDGIFNVGDGDYRPPAQFLQELARQLGADPVPEVTMAEAEATFSPRRLSFLRESRRVDTTRIRQDLGFEPRYPDATNGIRDSLTEECGTP